ncbi:beta strand repeat-containing protein, partial [Acinetobacter defluvii]|uniref:beta strand repeat-containing protein n=1 Tax=Acinetobacter defluvii TaxID=1871111 RepID=UPI0025B03BB1
MNKIYKVIWNATLGTWVAVSEIAKGKTKSSKVTKIIGAATVSLMINFSPEAMAAYTAGGGSGSATGSNGAGLAIGNGAGQQTQANAVEAIAIGANVYANGEQSTVIGNDIVGNGHQSVIIGSNYNSNPTTSTGIGGVAVGSGLTTSLKSPTANGIGSVAIGSSGDGATNKYNGAVATGNHSLALMAGASSEGVNSIAVGVNANAKKETSTAIGQNSIAAGQNALVIGGYSTGGTTLSKAPTLSGYNGSVAARFSTSLGSTNELLSGSTVGIGNRIIIGNNTALTSLDDLNIDNKMYGTTTSSHSVGIGDKLTINGGSRYAVAIGADIVVNQNSPDSFAFGRAATIGTATQTAEGGIAIGALSSAQNTKATAIGSGNLATGAYSTAIGSGGATPTQATGVGALALGGNATAGAKATSADAIAIGGQSNASGSKSVAIGNGATSNISGGVALGSGSVVSDSTGLAYATNTAAPTTVGSVAVGGRRIQNLADGSDLQDAVTVAQLDKVNDKTNTDLVEVLGGSATYNPTTNVFTAPTNIGGTGKNTINEAIAVARTEVIKGTNVSSVVKTQGKDGHDIYTVNADGAKVSAAAGSAVAVTAGAKNTTTNITDYQVDLTAATKDDIKKGVDAKDAVDTKGLTFTADGGTTTATKRLGESVAITGDSNINTVSNANGVQVKLNRALDVDSVKAGNTVISTTGVTTPKVTIGDTTNNTVLTSTANGLDVGNDKITNVKAGDLSAASTDAVNGSQLFTTNQNVATNTTNITKNAGDISSLQNQTWKIQANGDTASAVKASDTVQFLDGSNIEITRKGNDITIGSVAKPVYDSITVKNAPVDGTDVTNKTYVDGKVQGIADTPLTFVGDNAPVKVDRKLGETLKIDGGATGTLTDNNIGVVADATTNKLTVKLAQDLKGLNSVESKQVTIGDATNNTVLTSTANGLDVGNDKITNVKAGDLTSTSTDAVNGSQLFTTNQNVATNTTNITKNAGDISSLQNQTWKIQANGDTASAVKASDTVQFLDGSNIEITRKGNDITIGSVAKPVYDSITVKNAPVDGTDVTNKTYVDGKVQGIADTPLTFVGDNAPVKVDRKLGETLKIDGGATGTLTDNNIGVVADATTNKLTVKLADDLKGLNSVESKQVTIGDATTNTVLTSTANGLDVGNDKITNVKAGDLTSTSTDAVNGSQLFTTNQNVATNTTNITKNAGD